MTRFPDQVEKYKSDRFDGIYRGVVVNNQDPEDAGRIRVRVFGVFDDVKDDHLPWAEYADLFMQGNKTFGGFWVPDLHSKVWVFFERGDHTMPVYFAGAPAWRDMPEERDLSTYPSEPFNFAEKSPKIPHNRVFRTRAGHVLEFDDTYDKERIRICHRTGTQIVMTEDGDWYEFVARNVKRRVLGDVEEVIDGDFERIVRGNDHDDVEGSATRYVRGSLRQVSGSARYLASSSINVQAPSLVLAPFSLSPGAGSPGGRKTTENHDVIVPDNVLDPDLSDPSTNGPGGGSGSNFPPGDPSDPYSYQNTRHLIRETSSNALYDSEEEEHILNERVENGELPPPIAPEPVDNPTEVDDTGEPGEDGLDIPTDCEGIEGVDYSLWLSNSVQLRDLTTGAYWGHPVIAQAGFSEEEIVCNLRAVAINIIDPIFDKFGRFRINSGFRRGSGTSYHNRGMAVDLQRAGSVPASFYTEVSRWIMENLNIEEFGLEFGNNPWLHLAYNRTVSVQRRKLFTYHPSKSPKYVHGRIINYRDNNTRIA